eukprot:1137567-Pelagomonas_calceolata.AAC.1
MGPRIIHRDLKVNGAKTGFCTLKVNGANAGFCALEVKGRKLDFAARHPFALWRLPLIGLHLLCGLYEGGTAQPCRLGSICPNQTRHPVAESGVILQAIIIAVVPAPLCLSALHACQRLLVRAVLKVCSALQACHHLCALPPPLFSPPG